METLRSELRRLQELADGWSAAGEIPSIERDLALAKLRSLYDAVRFAAPAHDAAPAAESFGAVDLGLAAGLSFGERPAATAWKAPAAGAEPAYAAPVVAEEVQAASVPAVAEVIPAAPETTPVVVEEVPAASEPVPAVEEPVVPAAVSEAAPAAVEPAPVELAPAVEPAPAAEPAIGSAPEFVPEPAPASGSAPASAPVVEPAAEPAPAPVTASSVASTLFGPEEAVVRHRHKQRVIMSLYDSDPVLPSQRMPPPVVQPAPAPEDFMADAATPAAPEAPAGVGAAPAAPAPAMPAAPADSEVVAAEAASRAAVEPAPVSAPAPAAQPVQPAQPAAASESAFEPVPAPEPVAAPAPQPTPAQDPAPVPAAQPATRPAAPSQSAPAAESCPCAVGEATPVTVLGEAVNHDVQTLADTFAPQRDRADELACEAVDDLRRAIGINDKFLLVRDLFGGDAGACDAALAVLDGFDNLDDCMIHIAENYAWNANSDGAKFLMELLERKFA
ncbi:hypothetical protein [uncultured Alistipes sp.]|uniref:hypothetical protein n=1 Tax=uncultured Alistipes sp. TaxID=538949 RepID=UPI00262E7033|nr:hypothetical protein [uncultured Alistipes sp.]